MKVPRLAVLVVAPFLLVQTNCSAWRHRGQQTLDELRAHNRLALSQVRTGMSRDELTGVMGTGRGYEEFWIGPTAVDWREMTVSNPYRVENFEGTGGHRVEIVYYVTELTKSDSAISDDELTPIVLIDGSVVAWGWTAVRDVPAAEIRLR